MKTEDALELNLWDDTLEQLDRRMREHKDRLHRATHRSHAEKSAGAALTLRIELAVGAVASECLQSAHRLASEFRAARGLQILAPLHRDFLLSPPTDEQRRAAKDWQRSRPRPFWPQTPTG
jgi:hypothetical protein